MKGNLNRFFVSIVLPAILAIGLFVLSIFFVIVPAFERSNMEGKKEMISELTRTAGSLIEEYYVEVQEGNLDEESAQALAIERLQLMRYGDELKDYFWIIDQKPEMIMHPYRPELVGTSLVGYEDSQGKLLFVEAVHLASEEGEGFIDYMWQWKDDPEQTVPKLSYVKKLESWGWIVGTGIYLEDVREEIADLRMNLLSIALFILLVIGVLFFFIIRQSLKIERQRQKAEKNLSLSREKYKKLVEASTEGTLMLVDGDLIFSNLKFNRLSGYSTEEMRENTLPDLFALEWDELVALVEDPKVSVSFERSLICKDTRTKTVVISLSQVSYASSEGYILVLKELSKQEQFERASLKLEKEWRAWLLSKKQGVKDVLVMEDVEKNLESFFLNKISMALKVADLSELYRRIPVMLGFLLEEGNEVQRITSLLSSVSDAIHLKLFEFVFDELGESPCKFAFLVMGSEGRGEQTLATDQDNAMIVETLEGNEAYFKGFAEKVNEYLDMVGYKYCAGEVMVRNTKWLQELEVWKDYFSKWINDSEAQDVMDAGIFFDFRHLYGDETLSNRLRDHVDEILKDQSVFYYQMAQSILKLKPVSGLAGKISRMNIAYDFLSLDVKKLLLPYTAYFRLCAIKNGIQAMNSFDRLEKLRSLGEISEEHLNPYLDAYSFLTRIRLKNQVKQVSNKEEASNLVRVETISVYDRIVLARVVSTTRELVSSIAMEYNQGQ